jgi:hypothetical protein
VYLVASSISSLFDSQILTSRPNPKDTE